MSNEEFKVFIDSFENVINETDLKTKTKKLSEKQRKLHEKILALLNDVLEQVLICKSKVQEKKDKIKVANIIQKINSLKF